MVELITGDMFSAFDTKTVLVHGCNAMRVMGSGVALTVKTLYPQAFQEYRQTNDLYLGRVIFTRVSNDRIIANAITQRLYGRDAVHARPDAIRTCLLKVKEMYPEYRIIMPRIGCDRGGLEFEKVLPVIKEVFNDEQVCQVFTLPSTKS